MFTLIKSSVQLGTARMGCTEGNMVASQLQHCLLMIYAVLSLFGILSLDWNF